MAHIVLMKSGEFLKSFLNEFDFRDFKFLLISDDIKNDGGYNAENIYTLKTLLPPVSIINLFEADGGYTNKYKKKYLEYLSKPQIDMIIQTIVKMAVISNEYVILLCSDDEAQYKYTKLISRYISEKYGVEPCTYKEFRKDPTMTIASKKDKKRVLKIMKGAIAKPEKTGKLDKDTIKKKLKEYSKKDLLKLCKSKGVKVDKDAEKKDIIKKLLKKL